MKTIITIIILWCAVNTTSAQFTKAELQAAGLTCSMCSRAVDKQLRTLDFIDSIDIDLSHASFILFFKKDVPVDFSLIKKKVEDAGFSVAFLKATYRFDNLNIADNSGFTYQHMTFYFLNSLSKPLNGEVALQIVDKGFVSDKEFKKYAGPINAGNSKTGSGIYHVIL